MEYSTLNLLPLHELGLISSPLDFTVTSSQLLHLASKSKLIIPSLPAPRPPADKDFPALAKSLKMRFRVSGLGRGASLLWEGITVVQHSRVTQDFSASIPEVRRSPQPESLVELCIEFGFCFRMHSR